MLPYDSEEYYQFLPNSLPPGELERAKGFGSKLQKKSQKGKALRRLFSLPSIWHSHAALLDFLAYEPCPPSGIEPVESYCSVR